MSSLRPDQLSRPGAFQTLRFGMGCALVAAMFATTAMAQTSVYWDRNGNSAGAGANPDGTWNTGNGAPWRNWNTNAAGTGNPGSWTQGNHAIFSAGSDATGSYTVTLNATIQVDGITVQEGNPTFTGNTLDFTGSHPFFSVAAGSTATVASQISGSNGLSMTGGGLLAMSNNANNWSGGLAIDSGTVRLDTTGALASSNPVTIASSGTLVVNSGTNQTLSSLSGSGSLSRVGAGTLTFASNIDFAGSVFLGGGTLALGGNALDFGTLHITDSAVIDFGGNSNLNVGNLIVDAGATLTITNWVDTLDFFNAQNWGGAVTDTRGQSPMNQIVFTGFSGNNTQWQGYDNQITPVPEPSTYGAIFIGLALTGLYWHRRRQVSARI